ncbi:cyclophilin-like fold protein [Pseudomonas fluorescens]|nr:cyclophilin-like fold protein [Pseudomonas fluorescens]
MTLEDYTATEKISYLPRELTTEGTQNGYTPQQGQTQ